MGEVAVGLALQTHGAQLGRHIALWGGLVQGGLPDAGHLGDHEEGQHALEWVEGSGEEGRQTNTGDVKPPWGRS